jgi:hypothetical protein
MGAMQRNASSISAIGGGSAPTSADYAGGGFSLSDFGEAASLIDRVVQENAMMPTGPVGLTVEQLAEQLDLTLPTEQRIVVRVPTTPLTSQKELQREQPKNANPQVTTNQRRQAPRAVQSRPAASTNTQLRPRSSDRSQSPDWIRR